LPSSAKSVGDAAIRNLKLRFQRALHISRKNGSFRVALDIFSGSGRIACALRQLGIGCIELDIKHGHAISSPKILKLILGWIFSGCICLVWIATPCSSGSSARHDLPGGTGPRTRVHIYGQPNLSEADQARVKAGNITLSRSRAIVRACIKQGIPCGLENPASSLMWMAPNFVPLVNRGKAAVCDFCAFGTPWRKRTKLVLWNVADVSPICIRCRGRNGLCSFTSRRHIHLQGICKENGKHWTRIAEPYPRKFAKLSAKILADASQNITAQNWHERWVGF
jgi:hypothetical protein